MLIFIFSLTTSSAQKYDYQWLFGYGENKDLGGGISLLDFHNGDVDVSYYGKSNYFDIGYTGSFIDDYEGNIELITNNCEVIDKSWNVISGPEIITPDGAKDRCFSEDGTTYAAYQSALFLPDLADVQTTYLMHKDLIIDYDKQILYSDHLWFSIIKRNSNGYDFEKKYHINKSRQVDGVLTACPDKEKKKWWILMPEYKTGYFNKYLVGADTVIEFTKQKIGKPLDGLDLGIGQAQFSPDGSMLGLNSEDYGVLLYDFDNSTGDLSNLREIPYPDSKENVAKGLCFSPNNRFIYLTTAEHVYQIDLQQNNEIYHVGYYRSFDGDGWPVGLGMIFCGPDCKLYVSPGSTTYYLHVILNPDEKGVDCKFAERAIKLPTNLPHHLPNLPQYRYMTGCDSTIVFPFEVSVDENYDITQGSLIITPTPAKDKINIYLRDGINNEKAMIFDIVGRKIMSNGQINEDIDISRLDAGMYFIVVKDRAGRMLTGKFVKR